MAKWQVWIDKPIVVSNIEITTGSIILESRTARFERTISGLNSVSYLNGIHLFSQKGRFFISRWQLPDMFLNDGYLTHVKELIGTKVEFDKQLNSLQNN